MPSPLEKQMRHLTLAIALLLVPSVMFGQGATVALTPKDEAAIDSIFRQAYPAESPGATVLLARGDSVLYRKAFGMANVELRVPMRPEHVMQLASITKQFTSVATLMLVEQGKLSLQDRLSKFLPDFPSGGEITMHHLLNHSSGITSYTNVPSFRTLTRQDLSPAEILAHVKDLPLEFTPGAQYAYSNSGYLLLGMIIEQISGMPYAEFVQKNIFAKLGMTHSHYASNYALVANRASGYQVYEGVVENPEYLSPSIAYAAGSLMSTVDDMLLWNRALRQNTLISEESKRLAFANHKLANGRPSNYGYGWSINELADLPTVEHTGGINGYATSGIHVTDGDVYAIVLTNRDDGRGPESYNIRAVSIVLGKPIAEAAPVLLTEGQLKRWVGAYRFDDVVRIVTFEDGALYSAREGGRPLKLEPLSATRFRIADRLATFDFSMKEGKRQVRYTDRIVQSVGTETEKPLEL
ncbi:MAG: beta-lactamase family protein [Gemmatimonadaceae bacterium]|nr:beta-lactamase family protein [Gemmatimonadaceae bacterium]